MLHDDTEWKEKFEEALRAQQANKYDFAEHTWLVAVGEAEVFGPDDIRLAETLDKLTEFLLLRGKLDDAHIYGHRALEIYRKNLGENSDEQAGILANLAMLAKVKNDLETAESLYRSALAVNSRVLGPGEPRVKQLLTEFANVLDQLGRSEEADQLRGSKKRTNPGFMTMPKGLPSLNPLSGKPNTRPEPQTQPSSNKSGVFKALNQLMSHQKDGVKIYPEEEEPQKRRRVPEKLASTIIDSPENLQSSLKLEGGSEDFQTTRQEAERLFQNGKLTKAKQIWKKFIDGLPKAKRNTPDYCYALESLANIYSKEGTFKVVPKYLDESLDIKVEVLGLRHPVVASVESDLAKAYYSLGKYELAEEYAISCLNKFAEAHGDESIEVGNACHNLATLFHIQEKFKEAEKFYNKALPIKQKELGADHPETVRLENALKKLMESLDKTKKEEEETSSEISGAWRVVEIPESKPGWWKEEIFND